jgi:serine/threonine protein kinase
MHLYRSLPFKRRDDPQAINDQIVKCEIKMPRDSDQATRDLLQQIFVLEPNLRITLADMKQHKFFSDIDWPEAAKRNLHPVPYKPNPMKYKYLLSNKYE